MHLRLQGVPFENWHILAWNTPIPFTQDNFQMDYPVKPKLQLHLLKAVQVVCSLHTVLKVETVLLKFQHFNFEMSK